ncbi:MAG: hypothetical protein H8E13_04305, partial [Actinobacteria bacterium]|nr:hypothetical protein [Actinomycetota bacterium]
MNGTKENTNELTIRDYLSSEDFLSLTVERQTEILNMLFGKYLKSDKELMAMVDPMAVHNEHYTYPKEVTDQMAKDNLELVKSDFLANAFPNKKHLFETFDPTGEGYDYETALEKGINVDSENRIMPSTVELTPEESLDIMSKSDLERCDMPEEVPISRVLIGKYNPRIREVESKLTSEGYHIIKGYDGNYYTVPSEYSYKVSGIQFQKKVEREKQLEKWDNERTQIEGDLERRIIKGLGKVKLRPITIVSKKPEEESDEGLLAILLHEGVYTGNPTLDDLREDGVTREDMIADVKGVVGDYIIPPSPAKQHWTDLPTLGEEKREPPSYVKLAFTNVATGDLDSRRRLADLRVKTYLQSDRSEDDFSDFGRQEHFLTTKEETVSCPLETCPDHDIFLEVRKLHPETSTASMSREEAIELLVKDGYETLELKEREKVLNLKNLFRYTSQAGTDEKLLDYFQRTNHSYWDLFPKDIQSEIRILYDYKDIKPRYEKEVKELYQDVAEEYQLFNEDGSINKEKIDAGLDAVMPAIEEEVKKQKEIAKHQERWLEEEAIPAKEYAKRHPYFASWEAGYLHLFGGTEKLIGDAFGWDALEKIGEKDLRRMEALTKTRPGDEKGVTGLMAEGNWKQAFDLSYRQALQSAPITSVAMIAHLSGHPYIGFGLMMPGTTGARKYELDRFYKDLPEGIKWANAFIHGIGEAGSEMLGATAGIDGGKQILMKMGKTTFIKKGVLSTMKNIAKKGAAVATVHAYEMAVEGLEEGANQFWTNLADNIMGLKNDWKLGEGVWEAIVSGTMSAGFFEGSTITGYTLLDAKGRAIPFTIELKETGDKYKVVWDSGVSLDMINPKKGKFSVRGVDNEIYEFNKKDVKIKLSELSRKRAGKRLSENLSLAEEGTLKYKVSLEGVGDHYRLLHGAEKGSKKFAKELGEIAIKVRKNIASGNLDDLMDAKKLLDEMWIRNKRGVLDNYLTEEDKQKVKQEWKELNAQYIKVIDQREGKPLYYLDGKEYKNKDDFFKDAFSSITKAIDEGSTTKIAVENDDETLKVINNFIYNKKVIKEQKIKKEAEKAKEELSKKEKEIEGRRQEELKDITDTKKIEEINAKYDKELAALKKEPVKTTEEKAEVSEGKKVKVYRGTGGGVKSRGLKVLGSGKYFFTNKASAKIYGEEIDETEVSTDDLLVIDGNNYKEIAADVGVDIDGLSSKESVAKLGEIGKKIEEYAKKKGYKGVYAIDNVKDVDNGWHRFIGIEGADGTQIVVFEETKKEKQPAKELTKEQEKKKRGFFIGAHKKERFIREKLGLKGKENKPVFDKLIRAYKKHVTDKESMSDMTLEEAENYSNALIKSTDAINWIEKNRKTILETEVLEEEKEPVTSKLKDMYEIAEEGEGSLDYYMGTLESKDLKFIINTMIEENIVDDSFVKDLEDKNILRDGKFNLVGKVDKITKKEYLRREISKQFLKEFPTKKEKIEKKPKKSILEKDITKLDYSTEFRANPHLFTKEEWVGEYVRREGEDKRNTAEKLHKKGVEKALKGGKTIDDNVKADYPGLFKEKKAESRIEQPERTPVIGIGDLHGEDPNTLNEDLEANEITKDGEWDTDKTILIKPPPEILRKETTEVDNIIEIGEPQNIRGKRSDGNWIVSYKIKLKKGQKGVGGKDYFEKDKMFWKKEDAEKWIAENKVEKKKDQDYIMADEEIEKAIKASPTKDKNEFVRESINDFSFLLELNDEMDFQEFAEGIKKYADLGDLKNRVTYNAIRRSKGVVKRTPDKGINISIESVLEPTDVQKIKTDLPNKIAADILVDLKQYINPENKESDVSGLVSKDLEMKFTKRVAPLAESNPELYNELVAKKDVILKEAEQIAKDDIRKQFEGISKKKEEKKIAKRSPESPDEQREKGWKEGKDGEKIYRRKVIKNKKGEKKRKLVGKIKSLLFAKKVQPEGNLVIVEVEDIVPSHKHIGQEKLIRNIDNFIPEAQPKEREDDIVSAIEILETIQPNMWDPKKLSHLTETAYTGVISVNTRGEVIQGNNRAEFIRMAYKMFNNSSGAKYKAYLIEHADELGIDAEEIKKMKRPALVNMLDVSDGKAIELGNYTALDIETGGKQKMIPQNIVQKSRKTKGMLKNIVDMITHIGEGMEELSFRKIVKYNAEDALHYLLEKELITKDQYSTALEKGHITKEAIDVLEQVVTSGLMIGAPTGFMEKLRALPKDVQNVLTPIMPFLGEEENDWNIIKDVQDAVIGTYLFLDTTGGRTIVERRGDFTSWLDQIVIGEKVTPRERYSNFTLSLIKEFAVNRYSAKWSDVMIGAITSYHDLVTTPDLFHKTPDSKKGALLKIFGVEETDEWLKMFPRNIRSITQIYKTSDVRFREALSIEIPQLSEAAKKRLIRLNKSIFGDDWIRIVPEISENRKALGKYHDGWIDIVENRANPKDTFLHEAVHKAEDLFLTEEEKAELEKAMPGREKRAEDIINYQNGTKTFRGKVKRIIDKLLRVLRRLFGKTRNIDKVHDFYDRLMSGYYAQQKVPTTKLQPAMFSAPDVFYSKLARTVDNKFPTQMKAQSIPNWLKKQQVKPAEMDWMGLDEFLKGKDKVTIQEMQEFVAMNSLTLEEFILKEIPEEDIDTLLDDEIGEMMTREEAREYLKSDQESGYVKFSDYQLQGGTNYKEYFVTAPFNNLFEQKRFDYLDKKITELETKLGKKGISNVERTKITKEIESLMPEWKKYRWGIGKKIWEDGHSAYSDIENPVVRIRTNDRVLTDGRKFLHVE